MSLQPVEFWINPSWLKKNYRRRSKGIRSVNRIYLIQCLVRNLVIVIQFLDKTIRKSDGDSSSSSRTDNRQRGLYKDTIHSPEIDFGPSAVNTIVNNGERKAAFDIKINNKLIDRLKLLAQTKEFIYSRLG